MNVYELADRFKAELLAKDAAAQKRLLLAYQSAYQDLKRDWGLTSAKADALGRSLTGAERLAAWPRKRARDLMAQRLVSLADQTALEIVGLQRAVIAQARQDASEIVRQGARDQGATPDGVAQLGQHLFEPSQEAVDRMVGQLSDGTPLHDVLVKRAGAQADAMARILQQSIAAGWGPRTTAALLSKESGMSAVSALMIARTESIRVYRETNRAFMMENSDVIPQWRWHAGHNKRTCGMCLAMDGTLHPVSEPMASHPCCRCVPLPETAPLSSLGIEGAWDRSGEPERQSGEAWLKESSPGTQDAILGREKAAAWRHGDIDLKDLVHKHTDPTWGPERNENSLKAAYAKAGTPMPDKPYTSRAADARARKARRAARAASDEAPVTARPDTGAAPGGRPLTTKTGVPIPPRPETLPTAPTTAPVKREPRKPVPPPPRKVEAPKPKPKPTVPDAIADQKAHTHDSVEWLGVYTPGGKRIGGPMTKGDEGHVKATPEQVAAVRNGGILQHNHPVDAKLGTRQTSFSTADLEQVAVSNGAGTRVIVPTGPKSYEVHTIMKPPGGWPTYDLDGQTDSNLAVWYGKHLREDKLPPSADYIERHAYNTESRVKLRALRASDPESYAAVQRMSAVGSAGDQAFNRARKATQDWTVAEKAAGRVPSRAEQHDWAHARYTEELKAVLEKRGVTMTVTRHVKP